MLIQVVSKRRALSFCAGLWALGHLNAAENAVGPEPFPAAAAVSGGDGTGSRIRDLNGNPTFYFNGRPEALIVYRDHHPAKHIKTVRQFAANGIPVTTISVNALGLSTAKDKKSFFRGMDQQINEVLDGAPELRLMILLATTANEKTELYSNNAEESTVWPPFSKSDKQSEMAKGGRMSEASPIWQNTVAKNLFDIASHVGNADYANRIVGYLLAGPPGEWTDWYDFSAPALNGYKKWLKAKYPSEQALRDAWHDAKATFEDVAFPAWGDFFKGDLGIFFDPGKSVRKVDFLTYHHMLPGDVIGLFAEEIKEASGGKHVVGAYYGYFTGVEWDGGGADKVSYFRMRHKALAELLKKPAIDFIAAPYNYQERHAGGVFDYSLIPDSITLNGKMIFIEDDTRTHLTTPHPSYSRCEKMGDNFGQAKDLDETLSILKRNFAGIFSKCGSGCWYFGLSDEGNKWWDNKDIIKCIGSFSKMADDKLVGKDSKVSEIAVIGSFRSAFYQCFNYLPQEFITRQLLENVHRIGAPCDVYLDTDLSNPKFPFEKYKFFIFLNSFYLDGKTRAAIKEKLCSGGRTVLWIYADGIVDDTSVAAGKVEDLIGIKLGEEDATVDGVRCVVTDYKHELTKRLPKNLRFGPDGGTRMLCPVLWCADPDAEVLGELLATPSKNQVFTFRKPGLCVKKQKGWTSVWSPVPNVPSSLLRSIAQKAGVHIYDDMDDQVFASRRLLGVHARYDGPRTIRLPGRCDVYDPFKEAYVAKSVSEFTVDLKQGGTGLWLLEQASGH